MAKDPFWTGVFSAVLGGDWLQYRTLVEALEREKELYSVGAGEYAEADDHGRNRLLVERVENILVNGGAIAADEALQSVRNGWQLLVVEGSGRFADELSAAIRDGQSVKSTKVTEIVRSGHVTLFNVDDAAEKLKDELRRMLCG